MREEGTEIMGITNLKRFYAGYDMDKDEFVSIYYGGAYIGCICKPQRGRGGGLLDSRHKPDSLQASWHGRFS